VDLLTIVIPVHGQWSYTRDCLQSLREHTPGRFYRVVVADGGSRDETASCCGPLLAELFGERGEHCRVSERLSFARACNLGAKEASSDYLLFLNNDILLLPGWLEPLLIALRNEPRAGVAAPLLLYPGADVVPDWPLAGRVQHAGIALDPNKHPVHLYHGFPAGHPAVRRPLRLQAVSGAALLVPRQLFHELGGFHEGYRNGSEDLDFCAAVRAAGGRCLYEPRSMLLHYSGATPGRYEHVQDNARLLNARCMQRFIPDLHRLAQGDGFSPALNEWLEVYLREAAPEGKMAGEPATATPRNGKTESQLREWLERRPLDQNAYVDLAALQHGAGDLVAAARTLQVRAFLFPGLTAFSQALQACLALGDEGGVARWRSREQAGLARLRQLPRLLEQARDASDWFDRPGQEEIRDLYLGWIEHAEKQTS